RVKPRPRWRSRGPIGEVLMARLLAGLARPGTRGEDRQPSRFGSTSNRPLTRRFWKGNDVLPMTPSTATEGPASERRHWTGINPRPGAHGRFLVAVRQVAHALDHQQLRFVKIIGDRKTRLSVIPPGVALIEHPRLVGQRHAIRGPPDAIARGRADSKP